jgi:hypothetical protein
MKIGCYIKLGTMVHAITELITFGNAYRVAYWIAKRFGKEDCGCGKREQFLNCLTCKEECDE